MPSARDLLQQADALMRSNRNVGVSESEAAVPVLTDIAAPDSFGISRRQHRDEIPVLTNAVTTMPEPASGEFSQSDPLAPFSAAAMLRDNTLFPISQMPRATITGPAPIERQTEPASEAAMRSRRADAVNWDAEMISSAPVQPGPPPVPEILPVSEALRVPAEAAQSAAEIAENVYYQVLQNLDLYTERALQEHLTTHLSPILERASTELLATLHANLGGLIRQFVADAIEKQLGVRPDSSK